MICQPAVSFRLPSGVHSYSDRVEIRLQEGEPWARHSGLLIFLCFDFFD